MEIRSYGYLPGTSDSIAPLYMKTNGSYYWYHNDHLGTPQQLADDTGAIVWEARYTGFGKASIETETIVSNFRLPGQYYDEETGLHYNGNRYYDPDTGRYLRTDPLGLEGGLNLYVYALNNPLMFTDPDGMVARNARNSINDWHNTNFTSVDYPGSSGQPYASTMNYLPADAPLLNRSLQNGLIAPTYNLAVDSWNTAWHVQSGQASELEVAQTIAIVAPASKTVATALKYYVSKIASFIGNKVGSVSKSGLPPKVYNYTDEATAGLVEKSQLGLSGRTTYLTPEGNLSPIQAQIELALPQKNTAKALFEVNAKALDPSKISNARRVTGNVFNRGGGGTEMLYEGTIPLDAIKRIK